MRYHHNITNIAFCNVHSITNHFITIYGHPVHEMLSPYIKFEVFFFLYTFPHFKSELWSSLR